MQNLRLLANNLFKHQEVHGITERCNTIHHSKTIYKKEERPPKDTPLLSSHYHTNRDRDLHIYPDGYSSWL